MKIDASNGQTIAVVFKEQPFVPVPDSRGGVQSIFNVFAGRVVPLAEPQDDAFGFATDDDEGKTMIWKVDSSSVLMYAVMGSIKVPERNLI